LVWAENAVEEKIPHTHTHTYTHTRIFLVLHVTKEEETAAQHSRDSLLRHPK
jgi:hypothetical protein